MDIEAADFAAGEVPPARHLKCNIELKARIESLSRARQVAAGLSTGRLSGQDQLDTYFRCRSGRLKLREIDGRLAQLIWYSRADVRETKPSHYLIVPVAQPALLGELLSCSLGTLVTVAKHREIYLHHNVRIHLDQVDQLGTFLEFEAVLAAGQEAREGQTLVRHLQECFGIDPNDLLTGSYSDMRLSAAADFR